MVAVNPTKSPFWLTRSRKGGPSPGGTVDPESFTAIARKIGIKEIVKSIAQVRRRRNRTVSSDAVKVAKPCQGLIFLTCDIETLAG